MTPRPPPDATPLGRQVSPDLRGAIEAITRAGPCPRFGTLAEFETATDRATRAAIRTADLEYRWNRRHRFWENPAACEASAPNAARLTARQRVARDIADDRRHLLRRLLAGPWGRA